MWIALLTLTVLEIVLGIDNIIFISILAGKLPGDEAKTARQLGFDSGNGNTIAAAVIAALVVGP